MSKSLGKSASTGGFTRPKIPYLTDYATVRSNSFCSFLREKGFDPTRGQTKTLPPRFKNWLNEHSEDLHFETMTTRSVQSPPQMMYHYQSYQWPPASPQYYPMHIATLGRSRTEYGRSDHRRMHTPPSFMGSTSKLYEKRRSSPFSTAISRKTSKCNSPAVSVSRVSLADDSSTVENIQEPRRAESVLSALNHAMQSRLTLIGKKAEGFHVQVQETPEENSQQITELLLVLDREAKHYTFLKSTVSDLQEQYSTQLKLFQEAQRLTISEGSPVGTNNSKLSSSSPSLKGGLKQITHNLNYIENEVEQLMGTLHVELKGIQGFARIAPGDVFEVVLKHGQQKWKTKGKARVDRTQKWDQQSVLLKCLLHEPLEIKASEVRLLGKSQCLGEQSCELTRLFSAEPQLMTVNLNLNGSLKLHLVITWKPAESMPSKQCGNGHWSFGSHGPLSSKSPKNIRKTDAIRNGSPRNIENGVVNNLSKTMPSSGAPPNLSPRLIRCRPDRRIPLEFMDKGDTGVPAYKPPALLAVLRTLKPLIQKLLQAYPDLTALHDVFFKLDAMLKRSLIPSSVRSPRSNRKTVDLGSGITGINLDTDNIDDNFFTRSEKSETMRTHDSGFDSLRMGRTPQPDYIDTPPNNKGLSPRETSMKDKRKSWSAHLSGGEFSEPWATPQPPSTGSPQIDTCLYHHLRYCHVLLKNLDQLYGPLRHRRREIRMKLIEETSTLNRLMHISANPNILPNLNTLLMELDATHELQDIWLSMTAAREVTLHMDTDCIKKTIRDKYSHIVQSRYPDLVKQVFDKVDYWLSDRFSYSTELVTVFQFVSCFRDKQLPTFVESLAHESWINASLSSCVRVSVEQVMDRLSKVPIAPPQQCLAQIAVLLVEQPTNITQPIITYLRKSTAALRTDLISGFTVLLEQEEPQHRKGACKALAQLKAHESLECIEWVAKCDQKSGVREEATKTIAAVTNVHTNNNVHNIIIDNEHEHEHTKF